MNLFPVVLGGRSKGCHIEQHDVRWVVGDSIDDTLPELVRQWSGLAGTPYRQLSNSQPGGRAQRCCPVRQSQRSPAEATKLWFVNSVSSDSMAEQHHFGPCAPCSIGQSAARRRWLQGLEQIHKDDLHGVDQDPASMICCPSAAMVMAPQT